MVSPRDCQAGARAGGLAWSDWSRWGREETMVLTAGRLERVRRRYRLARHQHHCVSVMLDTRPGNTGGCHLDQLYNSVPRCA